MLVLLSASCNQQGEMEPTQGIDRIVIDQTVLAPPPAINYSDGDLSRREGKMLIYKNGAWGTLEMDIQLEDSTTVTPKGQALSKDGLKFEIVEGYFITKAGRFFDKTGAAIENIWESASKDVSTVPKEINGQLPASGENIKESTGGPVQKAKQMLEQVWH